MKHYRVKTVKGDLPVHVLAPEIFNGEYDRQSIFYVGGVWAVSTLAMLTNLTQALYRKATNGGGSFGKILWEMGRDRNHVSSFLGDRFSRYNHQAKYDAAGWRSLDLIYNYREKVKPQLKNNLEGWLTRYWIGKGENRQAVTNRLKIATDLLVSAFEKFTQEKEIRLLSIASGSAQAVVEAMKRCPHLNIKVNLIDADASAIAEAKRLVQEAGYADRFSFIHDTTKAMEAAAQRFKPHIIEMVGFLDDRPRKQAIALIDRIRQHLPEGGIFITCNIRNNREKIFLDWILLWPMIYRSEEEFADLLVHGGFETKNINLVYEPFQIHGIAVCRM
jgi:hypothetical protein